MQVVAEDDIVVARFRCTGTHRGDRQGLAPTGRTCVSASVLLHRHQRPHHHDVGTRGHLDPPAPLAGDDATLGELGSLS
ncbi:MAG: ester cyclase [Acidimicrobiales bacterium]